MEEIITFCFFIFILRAQITSAALTRRSVTTLNCEGGKCVLLRDCDQMLELLRNRSSAARKLVQQSICGTEGRRIKVCCGGNENSFSKENFFPTPCGTKPAASEDRIVNGDYAMLGEFPWIAAFGYSEYDKSTVKFMCSGSLINARYVITAAHCVHPNSTGRNNLSVIRFGDLNLTSPIDCTNYTTGKNECSPPPVDTKAEKIIIHPTYGIRADYGDDIALIRLDQTIDFEKSQGYIQPICIPPFGFHAEFASSGDGRNLIVSGWGKTERGLASDMLLLVTLPFADRERCKQIFKKKFGDGQLCVGGSDDGKDTCMGDSGAPLIMAGPFGPPFLQIGIVSYGIQACGSRNFPAVYTSVSHYTDWIARNMEPW